MNRLLKRKDKKQESPNEIPTPQAQPAPPPPPPDPFIEKIVQFRQKITDRIPSKNARIALFSALALLIVLFLGAGYGARYDSGYKAGLAAALEVYGSYDEGFSAGSSEGYASGKKATPPPFRKHRPRPRLHTTKAMPPDTMKAKTLAMPKVKKQAMRPEKPRVLPLDTIRATPREKQQPPRKPAIPARALARKMLVKSKRRALRFM